jgi:hypothetical protein
MKKQFILILMFSFTFIGFNCNPDDSYVDPKDQDEVLFYSSFDSDNETPNVKGWNLSDSLSSKYLAYSTDVINPYYHYSLKLQRDTITTYTPNINTSIIKLHSNANMKYFVTFYAKGNGEVFVGMKTIGESRTVVFNINSISWKYFNPKTFDCSGNNDTLTITFRPLINDTTKYLLLDNVSVQSQRR